jgi:hypothetical protein
MKAETILGIFLALLLLGCATAEKLYQDYEFDKVGPVYEHAIRWSDYRIANGFRKNAATEDNPPDFDKLAQFRVTSYRVKERADLMDKYQVRQSVEIGYYRVDSFVEKKITDHQIWEYDAKQRKWFLLTGLPDFK